MNSKLHHLLTNWPAGAVRSVTSLRLKGYSPALLAHYRKARWIASVGAGAVARTGDKVDYLGGVYTLQRDLELDVHIGGRSALELHHRAHFLRCTRRPIYVIGSVQKLPRWFTGFNWGVDIVYRSSKLFPKELKLGLVDYETQGFRVRVASNARAMAEYLDAVPKKHTFEEAKLLMGGLVDLPPTEVQKLLEVCQSVKVARLFLLLAEECGHKWIGKVDVSRINLGKGKRNLMKGGVLHPKFQITVPPEILEGRTT